jgi:hypothetical protein
MHVPSRTDRFLGLAMGSSVTVSGSELQLMSVCPACYKTSPRTRFLWRIFSSPGRIVAVVVTWCDPVPSLQCPLALVENLVNRETPYPVAKRAPVCVHSLFSRPWPPRPWPPQCPKASPPKLLLLHPPQQAVRLRGVATLRLQS